MREASSGIIALVSILMIAATAMAADAPQALPAAKFSGWADIDAAGRLQKFEPDGTANQAIARAISDELGKTIFVPAQGANGPIAVRVHVAGSYDLQEAGEEFVLRVREVRTGPKIIKQGTPRPVQRLLIGLTPALRGRVAFAISANGKPTDIVIETSSKSDDFDRAMREAITQWRFDPESVAVFPAGFRLRQEFSAQMGDTPALPGTDCPDEAPRGVHVKGQTTCLPVIEGSWRRRATR